MMIRAFSVHGHFYQPPREDPLTGIVPNEPGAAPYRNWNERILAECYRPNAELENFAKISFDVGPTLFAWLADQAPSTYQMILDQDRKTTRRYGVGNAMAQAYNHSILPLATREDKITQVQWGIADFRFRYGRNPGGIWLPETAVDTETLEILDDQGIRFTILAPWQVIEDVRGDENPFRVPLPDGREMVVFLYNRDISTRVSFDPATTINADDFTANTLLPRFDRESKLQDEQKLVLVATDGELYGHHQPFRDKFLAYLMDGALGARHVERTFPELWLQQYRPEKIVHIRENTSWSCSHGVARWMGKCGCTLDGEWKHHLRFAFDRLAKLLDREYQAAIRPFKINPWELRNEYVHVLLGERSVEDLICSLAKKTLMEEDLSLIKLLLAAQYERQRMFTSCGWFFEDFDRIEPRNNVAYAAQAIWLTKQATGLDLADQARRLLKRVRSKRTGLTGDVVFTYQINRDRSALKASA